MGPPNGELSCGPAGTRLWTLGVGGGCGREPQTVGRQRGSPAAVGQPQPGSQGPPGEGVARGHFPLPRASPYGATAGNPEQPIPRSWEMGAWTLKGTWGAPCRTACVFSRSAHRNTAPACA